MTTSPSTPTSSPPARPAVAAMYAGLALTVVATVVPFVDRATAGGLAEHIRAGYPAMAARDVDTAVTTYLIYLTVLGALGVLCWFGVIRAVRSGRRWSRGAASVLFVLAASVALFNLLVRDTSGDTGLSPLLGWVGVLPCVAGALAVVLLWRGPRPTPATA